MDVFVTGVGAWGPGFGNFGQFQDLLHSGAAPVVDAEIPKPQRIPARERRRSPLLVRLAVEVANQACEMAEVDPALAQSVFTSGIGDADITDYMCRVLAGPEKLLSPTKFHNSVHNAAAGCWSISTACERPTTFVSSMHNSFSMALLEALAQVKIDQVPVLLILTDLAMPGPLRSLHPIEHMLGVALLLSPTAGQGAARDLERAITVTFVPVPDAQNEEWPELKLTGLTSLYKSSPAARSLCLLEALSQDNEWQVDLPVTSQLGCRLSLAATASLLAAAQS